MGLSEVAGVSQLEAWSMPYRYAIAVADLAIRNRADEPATRREKVEPVTLADGHTLPPGMSQMVRIFGMV